MQPEEIMVLITLILMAAYGLSRLHANWPRLLAWVDSYAPRAVTPPRQPRRVRMPVRSHEDRAKELQWIAMGLKAGLDLQFMARALRGNPAYNRRRVRKVRAKMQQAVTV